MSKPYQFPDIARDGRVITKSKIYAMASLGKRMQRLFVTQVEKIVCSYSLDRESINLAPAHGVDAIQVFTIFLRQQEISPEILAAIDKAIRRPLLFQLVYNEQVSLWAAYKRPSEADKSKTVVGSYSSTPWAALESEKRNLPVALNLGTLYHEILKSIIPIQPRPGEAIETTLPRLDELRVKEREADRLEARIRKQKQFNHKVELNHQLKSLRREIEQLQSDM